MSLTAFALALAAAWGAALGVGAVLARAGFPVPDAARRIGAIDGLRGVLALAVVGHHFALWLGTQAGLPWAPPLVPFVNELGAGAVGLFFMATGLVFHPVVRAGFAATDWRKVMLSRVFRIVPAVVVSVGMVLAVVCWRTGRPPDRGVIWPLVGWIGAFDEPPLLGYRDSGRINAFVLWSLHFEWLFYLLLLPVLALASDAARAVRLPAWSVAAAFLLASLVARWWYAPDAAAHDLLLYLPLFACGMIAWECHASAAVRGWLMRPLPRAAAPVALLAGMALARYPHGAALPLFAFFFASVACGNRLGGLLSCRAARVLGECSFGVYLLHGIVLDGLFTAGAPVPVTMLPVAAAGVVLMAAAVHLTVERPMIAAGRRLSRRPGRVVQSFSSS
ncbi:MAG: acyltransferase family protein [Sphingomonadales bacterium]|nr:acyltransferase family protein [Sphingomonadales bacterium]